MLLWPALSILVWGAGSVFLILVLLLQLCVQLWQKSHPWDLQHCSTDLTGKTAIVTGANSGIRKVVSQDLAQCGAQVVLTCQSRERGQQALAEIQAASNSNGLLLGEVDLSSMTSIRSFAWRLLQENPEIHLLVNNAGVSGFPKTLTPDLDLTFVTNYVGPFLLTNLLQGALQLAESAPVVNVSSVQHAHGYIDEGKLLLTSFTGKLAQRLPGTGMTVNAVEPGVVYMGLMRHFSRPYCFLFWLVSFFMKVGVIPVLYLSLAEEQDSISGKYFSSSCVITLPIKACQDPHVAQSLCNASVRLTSLVKMD
uniref:Uncharacterized protein n=1 Tax=Piliocolobus tephrosceles TaxID=591936 RepID=A0A8C9IMQ6_9PRIM